MCAIKAEVASGPSRTTQMIAEFHSALERNAVVTLHRDETLLIRWLKGHEARLVVVFTGAGNAAGGLTADEFSGSASNGARNHVLFISDLTKSYYSTAGMMGRIADFIADWVTAAGIEKVYSIGNSMGGTGAILLAGEYVLDGVLAFCPAIDLSPRVTDDPVWSGYRELFGDDLVQDLGQVMKEADTPFHLIFGDRDADDRKHLAAVPDLPHVTCQVIPGQGHGITRWLKAQGVLADLVQAATSEDTVALKALHEQMLALAGKKPELGDDLTPNANRRIAI